MKAKFTKRAKLDLLEIWLFIADDNMDAADQFRETLTEAAHRIAEFPGAGRRRDDLIEGVRSFPVGKYLLLYREAKSGVQILRVIHGSRDLKSALDN